MENTIKVGNVVFQRNGANPGPGTVLAVEEDSDFPLDIITVFWQGTGNRYDHFRKNLISLAEKEATNVGQDYRYERR